MVVERKSSFSESRAEGIGFIPALFGKRKKSELRPGATNGPVKVIDEDTVEIRGMGLVEVYHGDAINELSPLCWRGDTEKVQAFVTQTVVRGDLDVHDRAIEERSKKRHHYRSSVINP